VLRRELLDAVERELELEVERLLRPERAVVVEDGDALLLRDEARSAGACGAVDERDDRRARRAVVPGGQRLGGVRRGREAEDEGEDDRGDRIPRTPT
jgi:hypothetical protein